MKDIVKLILDLGDISQEYMILVDSELNVVWVNHKLEMEGFDNKDVRGKKIKKVFKGKTEYCTETDIKKALKEKKIITKEKKKNKAKYEIAIIPITVSGNTFALVISAKKGGKKTGNIMEKLFENSPDSIVLLDLEGNIIRCNNKAIEGTGYKKEDIIGLHFSKVPFLSKEEIPKLKKIFSDAKKGRKIEPFEVESQDKKGNILVDEVLVATMYVGEKLKGFEITLRDITERKNLEEEFKESEKRFKTIIESSREVFYVHNTNNKLIYVSPQSKKLFGYEPEEMMVKWTKLVTDNPMNKKGIEITEKSIKTGKRQPPYELEAKKRDGTKFYVEVNETPIKNDKGEVVKIIGSLKDITQEKEAKKKIEEHQKEIQQIFDNLPIGIAVNKISTGEATHVNDKFSEIYGWPKEELTDVETFFKKVYPDSGRRNKMKKRIMFDMESGDVTKMKWENIKIKTKEGEEKFVDAANIPLPDQDLMISTVTDVTGQKKYEEESEKLNAELSKRVDELERFQKLTVGRELKMIELKKELKKFKEEEEKNEK